MSFKRDESSFESMHLLQKRRVDELLSENIPEDEALLLKNGRFTCLVCKHRPIFDTVNMLTVHRNGKKHTYNAEHFVKNKQYLADLIEERKQQESLQNGSRVSIYPQVSTTQHLGLATSVPYDPRARKKPCRPYERKQVLDLRDGNPSGHADINTSSYDIHKQKSKIETDSHASFNTSQRAPPAEQNLKSLNSGNNLRQSYLDKDCPQTIQEYMKRNQSKNGGAIVGYKRRRIEKDLAKTEGACSKDTDSSDHPISIVYHNTSTIQKTKHTHNNVFIKKEKLNKTSDTLAKSNRRQEPIDEKRQELAQKYLQLRSAGWKKDLSGKWVKDEEVEFDSDEEPPTLP